MNRPFQTVCVYCGSATGNDPLFAESARAIGQANGRNPLPIVIPCHRVIASGGSMGGYSGGLARKYRLLALEGVAVAGILGRTWDTMRLWFQ